MRALAVAALLLLLPTSDAGATARRFVGPGFSFPMPDGYADIGGKLDRPGFVALEAKQSSRGYRPTIAFQRTPIAGGSMGDPTTCTNSGTSVAGGANGKLVSASIVDGPVGKTCQIHIVAPAGVALITELNLLDAKGLPRETWLMTCNHAEGDAAAERTCRQTLAGFKLTR